VISSHLNPDNGKPIPENKKSEVRFYKCGPLFVLHDENPDKILREITADDFGTSDILSFYKWI
jgi:hypothetical protein